eukprot:TRINITY_DN22381_c0_g1_i1.p1 TRINITY_DN22381_c0_g1~~TRINITY_DN22381_c0_g1_i1.p1  ORF type:complete len:474 (-),score=82.49 TRINITY_DN22381_c0_g1_i1:11-1432(-)
MDPDLSSPVLAMEIRNPDSETESAVPASRARPRRYVPLVGLSLALASLAAGLWQVLPAHNFHRRGEGSTHQDRRKPSKLFESKPSSACGYVYVMRHCVRGTGLPDEGKQSFGSIPFPDWDTPDKWCLGGGTKITEAVGRFLRDHYGLKPEIVRMTTDLSMRRVQSGFSLMYGIYGTDKIAFETHTNGMIFDATKSYALNCAKPDRATQISELRSVWESTPMPMGLGLPKDVEPGKWKAVLRQFKKIMGAGAKDIMTLAPPDFDHDVEWSAEDQKAHMSGAAKVLKYFSQQFYYALAAGSGLEKKAITFGGRELNATLDEILPLYGWEAYERELARPPSLKVTMGVAFAGAVLEALDQVKDNEAQIFSGGDTQLDIMRAVFNITWANLPFSGSPGPTPPNTGLMIKKCKGQLSIDVVNAYFDGSLSPPVKAVRAIPAELKMEQLKKRGLKAIKEYPSAQDCAKANGVSISPGPL